MSCLFLNGDLIFVKNKITAIHSLQNKMLNTIIIHDLISIDFIKEQFHRAYPYLKIEFFSEPHLPGKGNLKTKMITSSKNIGELQRVKKQGSLMIDSKKSVGELENHFENEFGLHVQVFRKSGNIWLETTSTDDWTLEQQNEEGKNLAQHFNIEKENPEDHDIY